MSAWQAFFLGLAAGWAPCLIALLVLWLTRPRPLTIHDDEYDWDARDLAPRGRTDVSKRPF